MGAEASIPPGLHTRTTWVCCRPVAASAGIAVREGCAVDKQPRTTDARTEAGFGKRNPVTPAGPWAVRVARARLQGSLLRGSREVVVDMEPTPRISTRWYREGRLEEEGFPLEEVSAKVAEPAGVLWVGTSYDQTDVLEILGRQLKLHELALEDAQESFQRPKFEVFSDHALLVCHLTHPTRDVPPILRTTEVDALLGSNWLVTVTKAASSITGNSVLDGTEPLS